MCRVERPPDPAAVRRRNEDIRRPRRSLPPPDFPAWVKENPQDLGPVQTGIIDSEEIRHRIHRSVHLLGTRCLSIKAANWNSRFTLSIPPVMK